MNLFLLCSRNFGCSFLILQIIQCCYRIYQGYMISRLFDWCFSCWDCKNLLDRLLVGSFYLDNSDRLGIYYYKFYLQGWFFLIYLCSNIQLNMILRKYLDWKTSSIFLVDRMCSRLVMEVFFCYRMFFLDKVWGRISLFYSRFFGDRGRQRSIAKVWERKILVYSSIQ